MSGGYAKNESSSRTFNANTMFLCCCWEVSILCFINRRTMSLSPGQKLLHYEITESIGVGGMGEVYRARDTKLDRDVAIKVLPDSVARDAKTRFLAVRVISDDMSADLPPEVMSILGRTGSIRAGAVASALWKRPTSAKDMWRLRENATRAAERLATFLDGVVKQLATV